VAATVDDDSRAVECSRGVDATVRVEEMLQSLFADRTDGTCDRYAAELRREGINDEVVGELTVNEWAVLFGGARGDALLAAEWLAPAPPSTAGGAEPPQHLLCPITYELMDDPVILVDDSYTYERRAIEEHLRRNGLVSPMTNEPVSGILVLSRALRDGVSAWREENES